MENNNQPNKIQRFLLITCLVVVAVILLFPSGFNNSQENPTWASPTETVDAQEENQEQKEQQEKETAEAQRVKEEEERKAAESQRLKEEEEAKKRAEEQARRNITAQQLADMLNSNTYELGKEYELTAVVTQEDLWGKGKTDYFDFLIQVEDGSYLMLLGNKEEAEYWTNGTEIRFVVVFKEVSAGTGENATTFENPVVVSSEIVSGGTTPEEKRAREAEHKAEAIEASYTAMEELVASWNAEFESMQGTSMIVETIRGDSSWGAQFHVGVLPVILLLPEYQLKSTLNGLNQQLVLASQLAGVDYPHIFFYVGGQRIAENKDTNYKLTFTFNH